MAPKDDLIRRQGQVATPAAFYLGLCRLRGNLSPPAPATVILQAGNSSMRLRTLQAGHSILRQRASAGGLFYLPRRLLQAELQYFATKKIGIGRGTVAATPAQASNSTCRHDGTAAIPDFKPRLANRCSQKVKTGAIRASIPDFKPRLENRSSQKVKTGAIHAAQGPEHCAAAGECRMGRDFGRRSRPWLRERGPPRSGGRESTAGAHRSEVPARRQTRPRRQRKPRRQTRRGDSPIPRRQTRPRKPTAAGTKKESRLIAESGLSKRGSYLLSHLV